MTSSAFHERSRLTQGESILIVLRSTKGNKCQMRA
jgi:hypothetical protein